MNFGRKTRMAFVAMACSGLLMQTSPSFAAPPKTNDTVATAKVTDSSASDKKTASPKKVQPAAIDVALEKDGVISGKILDAKNKGVAKTPVTLRQGKEEIASTTTDEQGRFQVKNLKGGMYVISANKGHGLFRFWAPKSAPPAAHDKILVMSDAVVVRAQNQTVDGSLSHDDQDLLYDENGNPYARIYVVQNGVVDTGVIGADMAPAVGSGGLMGLDIFTVTLLGAAITGAVFAGIALDEANDDSSGTN